MTTLRNARAIAGACAAIGLLAGCATPLAPTQSGFIKGAYSDLKPTDGNPRVLSKTFVDAATLASYRAVIIDPPTVRTAKLADAGRVNLTQTLSKALNDEFGRDRTIVTTASARTLRVRAAITAVDSVNVPLNVVSSIGFVSAVDNGGAAAEAEIVDAETGETLVELSFARNAGAGETFFGARSYTELGHARGALERFAKTLASLTRPPEATPTSGKAG